MIKFVVSGDKDCSVCPTAVEEGSAPELSTAPPRLNPLPVPPPPAAPIVLLEGSALVKFPVEGAAPLAVIGLFIIPLNCASKSVPGAAVPPNKDDRPEALVKLFHSGVLN